MRLVKYTAEPLEFDPDYVYRDHEIASAVGKPRGLWVSDEDDHGWRDWCESEEWNLAGLAYETEFTLAPDANVLIISTDAEFKAFTAEYAAPLFRPDEYVSIRMYGIDWTKVAERYDGIIISPYRWESRFDIENFWYSGWDVASGCIWNLHAIRAGASVLSQVRMEG